MSRHSESHLGPPFGAFVHVAWLRWFLGLIMLMYHHQTDWFSHRGSGSGHFPHWYLLIRLKKPIARHSMWGCWGAPFLPWNLTLQSPACCQDRGCPEGGRFLPADHAGTRRFGGKSRAGFLFKGGWEGEGIEPCKMPPFLIGCELGGDELLLPALFYGEFDTNQPMGRDT